MSEYDTQLALTFEADSDDDAACVARALEIAFNRVCSKLNRDASVPLIHDASVELWGGVVVIS